MIPRPITLALICIGKLNQGLKTICKIDRGAFSWLIKGKWAGGPQMVPRFPRSPSKWCNDLQCLRLMKHKKARESRSAFKGTTDWCICILKTTSWQEVGFWGFANQPLSHLPGYHILEPLVPTEITTKSTWELNILWNILFDSKKKKRNKKYINEKSEAAESECADKHYAGC